MTEPLNNNKRNTFWNCKVLQTHPVLPVPVNQPTIYPKSPSFFYWTIVLESKSEYQLYSLLWGVIASKLPQLPEQKNMYITRQMSIHIPMNISMCIFYISVQFSRSVVSDSLRPHGLQHARLPCPSWSLLKLMSFESVMLSNHLILCCPLLLLPSIFPSIRVFSSEPVLLIRWPKYWSFSFSINPSKEY